MLQQQQIWNFLVSSLIHLAKYMIIYPLKNGLLA